MTLLLHTLQRRRTARHPDSDSGFTLIELLVVVIIIGILAAIAIPVYLGVQANSKNAGVQTDLSNLKTAVVAVTTNGGTLPAATTSWTTVSSMPSALTAGGATLGASTSSVSYAVGTSGAFCVQAISVTGTSYAATDKLGLAKGSCTSSGVYSTATATAAL